MASGEDRQFLECIDGLDQALSEGGPPAMKTLDLDGTCQTYLRIRPFLEQLLPWIGRLPLYGRSIAEAIRLLMKLADLACPTPMAVKATDAPR